MVFGNGWAQQGIVTKPVIWSKEASLYKNAKISISISHFNYKRYSSDRLLRILGAGGFALSHNYKNIGMDFEKDKHLDTFNSIPELVQKCEFWLKSENQSKRSEIALNGHKKAHSECKWQNRANELQELFDRHRKR